MNFQKNWGYKGSPGSGQEPHTGDNRKKNTFNIALPAGNVKRGIFGREVRWETPEGETKTGQVIGECCPNMELGLKFYRVQQRAGKTVWMPGTALRT